MSRRPTLLKKKKSDNIRDMVRALNASGLGHFFRVKGVGGFDKDGDKYRKYGDLDCIPHICGFLKNSGKAVFIEPKYLHKVEDRKELVFPVNISDKMKEFLNIAANGGALAGVAFTVYDSLSIIRGYDPDYPRHPRTYCFLNNNDKEIAAMAYVVKKKALVEKNKDPLARDIF